MFEKKEDWIISREAPNRRTFIDYYVRSSDQKWVASRPVGDIVRTSYENMRNGKY